MPSGFPSAIRSAPGTGMPSAVAAMVHCALASDVQVKVARATIRTVGRNGLDIVGGRAGRGASGAESNTKGQPAGCLGGFGGMGRRANLPTMKKVRFPWVVVALMVAQSGQAQAPFDVYACTGMNEYREAHAMVALQPVNDFDAGWVLAMGGSDGTRPWLR